MADYNGYPNRATWNVSLWLNNEQGHYCALQGMAQEAADADTLAVAIEEYCSEVWPNGLTPDGDKLSACKWDVLAANEWDEAHPDDLTERTEEPEPEPTYEVFVRDWWRMERGRRVPNPGGDEEQLATGLSYEDAREMCDKYNSTHEPGEVSRKAEFRGEL